MMTTPDTIELHCRKCRAVIPIEAGDEWAKELAYRLSKLFLCDACSVPAPHSRHITRPASTWLERSLPKD